MIAFLSSWAKGIGFSLVIVSILEMLLPNNTTKKYINMILGLFVVFTIISPFIKNKKIFDINEINLDRYLTSETSSKEVVDQGSMDERIESLYGDQLKKDIISKLKNKGFNVISCKVETKINDNEEESKIKKIKIKVEKNMEDIDDTENSESSVKKNNLNDSEEIEKKIVSNIQKIKPIEVKNSKEDKENVLDNQNDNSKSNNNGSSKNIKLNRNEKDEIREFISKEYGVSDKCLEIN